MSENHLPKNIGKKIAEALKQENLQSIDNSMEKFSEEAAIEPQIEAEPLPEPETIEPQMSDEIFESTSFGVDFDDVNFDEPTLDETDFDDIMKETPKYQSVFSHSEETDEDEGESPQELKLSIDLEDDEEDFEMPHNIQVLKRLIAQLPTGVPRQTGAQIIRQTIEALGIPMKSVLQDAQKVRECLTSSIKDCSFTIQEYRSNIKNLEKQSANYQKQLSKLNDVIELFVYNNKR